MWCNYSGSRVRIQVEFIRLHKYPCVRYEPISSLPPPLWVEVGFYQPIYRRKKNCNLQRGKMSASSIIYRKIHDRPRMYHVWYLTDWISIGDSKWQTMFKNTFTKENGLFPINHTWQLTISLVCTNFSFWMAVYTAD